MMRELRVMGAVTVGAGLQAATKLDTLEEVLHWGGDVLEVVVQDEYTHDVIVRAHETILVFDTT